ncbi:MAG TPA: D-aminoacyl-tRNA deacylase [Bacteroidales bacterium]|nr:D-aminoacyl-tRNA deacylase [Bacteroidales bacterium]
MRVVIQRVLKASVTVNNECIASIEKGLLVFIGIAADDDIEDVKWLCKKIVNLRIFNDDKGIMNLSINNINGEALIVSQFTLHASTSKGNRPSYIKAAHPNKAIPLYEIFIKTMQDLLQTPVKTGRFGAAMKINLINDGPVTIIIDSKNKE